MDYSYSASGDISDGVAAALGISIMALCLVLIAIWVLFIIAYWKMFTKAGEKGWKSIIPIYNNYVAFRIAWKDGSKGFAIYIIAMLAYSIFAGIGTSLGDSSAGGMVMNLLSLAAAIVGLVYYVKFCLRQAAAYSKGTACGVLSIFFPNILALYYGFGSTAVYQGPQD